MDAKNLIYFAHDCLKIVNKKIKKETGVSTFFLPN